MKQEEYPQPNNAETIPFEEKLGLTALVIVVIMLRQYSLLGGILLLTTANFGEKCARCAGPCLRRHRTLVSINDWNLRATEH